VLKIKKAKGVKVFCKKPKPTLGISVAVIAFPHRSKDDQGGIIEIQLAQRLSPESIGDRRVVNKTRIQTIRMGRSIVTVLDLRLPTATMLHYALNKILDDPDIIKEMSDEHV